MQLYLAVYVDFLNPQLSCKVGTLFVPILQNLETEVTLQMSNHLTGEVAMIFTHLRPSLLIPEVAALPY